MLKASSKDPWLYMKAPEHIKLFMKKLNDQIPIAVDDFVNLQVTNFCKSALQRQKELNRKNLDDHG